MTRAQRLPFPRVGEIFELTTSEEVTGPGLATYFRCETGFSFSHTSAPTILAGATGRFKLVRVGYQENLAAVIRELSVQDYWLSSGCWIKVFHKTFGGNGNDLIAVPTASWVDTSGHAHFPMIDGIGGCKLEDANCHPFFFVNGDRFLWLVEVEDSK